MTTYQELSEEQRSVVDSFGRGLAVMAGAGSGKTTTLVIKCEELLKRNSGAKFAAVSFTERSASDLRVKLTERLSLEDHWVMTIHGLCSRIIREHPKEAGFDGEESILSDTEANSFWEKSVDNIWSDRLPDRYRDALSIVLDREGKDSIEALFTRLKSLMTFGVLDKFVKADDPATKALLALFLYVHYRYEGLKRRNGVIDFDDMEKGAERALLSPSVRSYYQKKFDLVLVDEFQDTNPVQANIVKAFVKRDYSNLCVVGDPKQSIYRFRDADVGVFEDFCKQMPERLSLTYNFRSRPGIIDFSNVVCVPAFESSELRYEPLIPKRASSDQAEVSSIFIDEPADLGGWLARQVKNGAELSNFALLLRKIRGNERWLNALSSSGIPLAVGSGGLFWEDSRVRELVCFLRFWADPQNIASAVAFFRAPWVGVDDDTIDSWMALPRETVDLREHFLSLDHPIAKALLQHRNANVRPGELLLALITSQAIEDELGVQIIALWHRCEELSKSGNEFGSVVQHLSRSMKESRREREVPPPRNRGQLTVLTLHAAKGLEFPYVILVDLNDKPSRTPNSPLLYWDRNRGAFLAKRDGEGNRLRDDEVELEWRDEERRRNVAESKRLFYVAITRAREKLFLVTSRSTVEMGQEVFEKDFWRGWVEKSTGLPLAAQDFYPDSSTSVAQEVPMQELRLRGEAIHYKKSRYSVTELNAYARCPRYYEWTYVRPHVEEKKDYIASESPTGKGTSLREIGSAVHAFLETNNREHLDAITYDCDSIIEWSQRSEIMVPADQTRLVWKELSFEAAIADEVVVGTIDRLVVDNVGKKRFSIIDYKVTEKEKSLEDLEATYSFQLNLYRECLHKLDPESIDRTDLVIVNFGPHGVIEHPISLSSSDTVEGVVRGAARVVDGEKGLPRKNALCSSCGFLKECSSDYPVLC